jgi:MerR family transcriptional regulator, light-induced transcriptional regulator
MESFSPKQVARALGVSEASLKRWCDRGRIESTRSAGGHRRIRLVSVLKFLREQGQAPVRPEILGLPPMLGVGDPARRRMAGSIMEALRRGDAEQVWQIVTSQYLEGRSLVWICDGMIGPAVRGLERRLRDGELAAFEFARVAEISREILHRAHGLLPPAASAARTAVGACGGECSVAASEMASLCLHEAGWRVQTLGVQHPLVLSAAITAWRPRLAWYVLDSQESDAGQVADLKDVASAAAEAGGRVAIDATALRTDFAPPRRGSFAYATFDQLIRRA